MFDKQLLNTIDKMVIKVQKLHAGVVYEIGPEAIDSGKPSIFGVMIIFYE